MIRCELCPDEPSIYIPCAIFVGRGMTEDSVHYEGFKLADGTIHYYATSDGKEIPDDCNTTE